MSLPTETPADVGDTRRLPVDLAICLGLAVGCWHVVTSVPSSSTLRPLAAVALLLFVPGYSISAVLFPTVSIPSSEERRGEGRLRGISIAERFALAVGLSITVLPVVVVALGLVSVPLTAASIGTTVTSLTVVAVLLGTWRRLRQPAADRFAIRPRRWLGHLTDTPADRRTAMSTVVLVAAIGLAGGVFAYAIVSPTTGSSYSEVALYGETEDGDRAIGAVPEAVEPETEIPVSIEVTNREGTSKRYTVVVQQRPVTDGTVGESVEVTRMHYDLDSGERDRTPASVTPIVGLDETVRVVALVYESDEADVPADPTIQNADDYVYFHTHVTDDPDDDDTIVVDG
ncbi:DUF1616 domain-containing protein [Halovivax cerinus]|uniref:DUF1616 domain-containing protein n=1 Tax=Halovivax cerinus TaxID=1487865 RepID=A0ABD5NN49_9EURY|nr:DUF1616 domain-containing protein [Halovivax cerinus]